MKTQTTEAETGVSEKRSAKIQAVETDTGLRELCMARSDLYSSANGEHHPLAIADEMIADATPKARTAMLRLALAYVIRHNQSASRRLPPDIPLPERQARSSRASSRAAAVRDERIEELKDARAEAVARFLSGTASSGSDQAGGLIGNMRKQSLLAVAGHRERQAQSLLAASAMFRRLADLLPDDETPLKDHDPNEIYEAIKCADKQ